MNRSGGGALLHNFDIPPENLVTHGYGGQFLKVATEAPERENRRVAIRPITELVRAGYRGGASPQSVVVASYPLRIGLRFQCASDEPE